MQSFVKQEKSAEADKDVERRKKDEDVPTKKVRAVKKVQLFNDEEDSSSTSKVTALSNKCMDNIFRAPAEGEPLRRGFECGARRGNRQRPVDEQAEQKEVKSRR